MPRGLPRVYAGPVKAITKRAVIHDVPATRQTASPTSKIVHDKQHRHIFHVKTSWIAKHLSSGQQLDEKLVSKMLFNRRIPASDLALWVDLVRKKDPQHALQTLGLLHEPIDGEELPPCPDWLYMSIPLMLTKQSDAPYVASMLGSWRFNMLPRVKQGVLTARAISAFIRVNHLVAAREAIDWLVEEATYMQSPHGFACCFFALTTARHNDGGKLLLPPDSFLRYCLNRLRTALDERKIRGTSEMCHAMLHRHLLPHYADSGAELILRMPEKPDKQVISEVVSNLEGIGTSKALALCHELLRLQQSPAPHSPAPKRRSLKLVKESLGQIDNDEIDEKERANRELVKRMQQYLHAGHANAAVAKWHEAMQVENFEPTSASITAAILALCADRQPAQAIRLFRSQSTEHDSRVDVVALNALLSGLNRAGHYKRALAVFDAAETEFAIKPDHATLSILLDTVRYLSAASARSTNEILDDKWHGAPAWRTASRVAFDMLEQNFARLRRTATGPLERRNILSDWWTGKLDHAEPESTAFMSTFAPDPPRLPSVHPTERTFRSLIQLIGFHAAPAQAVALISKTLGWMRALDCQPTKSTLSLALLYMDEAVLSFRDVDRLYKWLRDWLPPDRIPDETELGRTFRHGKHRQM